MNQYGHCWNTTGTVNTREKEPMQFTRKSL